MRARRTPALSAARLFFEFPRNAVVAGRGPLLEWFARFNTGFAVRFTRFVLVKATGTYNAFVAMVFDRMTVLSRKTWETCRFLRTRLVLTIIACLALVRFGTVRVLPRQARRALVFILSANLFFELSRGALEACRGTVGGWFARFNAGFAARFPRFILVLAVGTQFAIDASDEAFFSRKTRQAVFFPTVGLI